MLGHRRRELAAGAVVLAVVVFAVTMMAWKPWRAFVDVHVDDAAPSETPSVSTGEWRGASGFRVEGDVELSAGYLRLDRFSAEATPDAHVVLTAGDATLDLGALRGNVGDLTYPLPAGTTAAAFQTVEIRDRVIGEAIGTATLTPVG